MKETEKKVTQKSRGVPAALSLLQVKSHALLGALITLAQIQQRLLWQRRAAQQETFKHKNTLSTKCA